MNVQQQVGMNKAAFLAWAEGREGRYEFAEGHIIMMVGASRRHGIIVMNLAALIKEQLDASRWTVLPDFGLDLGPDTLRYPDIVIDRAGGGLNEQVATAPVLIIEVLSPSTSAIDLGDKAAEYLQIPSLAAYLAFAQDRPKVWSWVRGENGFPAGPHVVAGDDKIIHVAALKLVLPLAMVYLGALGPEQNSAGS
jgi:Uma2 family endonuclease